MRPSLLALITLSVLAGCTGPDGATPSPSAAGGSASDQEPSASERAATLAVLQTFFDALKTGDADLLKRVVHPEIVMRSTATNAAGETSFASSTPDDLAARLGAGGPPLIERMFDPVVRVSGAMATIWTPYDFYVGADFSHCGVDAATLMNSEDGWQIVSLTWTRLQPPVCARHPEGPPGGL